MPEMYEKYGEDKPTFNKKHSFKYKIEMSEFYIRMLINN